MRDLKPEHQTPEQRSVLRLITGSLVLVIDVIVGTLIGSRLVFVSKGIHPFPLTAGILCFLAVITAVISSILSRKGKTGGWYIALTALTVLLHIPVVFYAAVFILALFGVTFLPPPQQ